jgi:eukaryotic-like serine/threonine-protein kinase
MPIFNPNGQTFADRYYVVERIGGGGMGEVYKAIDNRLNREVAIKFLSQDMIGRDDIRRRFENDATITQNKGRQRGTG